MGGENKTRFFGSNSLRYKEEAIVLWATLSDEITHAEMKNQLTSIPRTLSDIWFFRVVRAYKNYGYRALPFLPVHFLWWLRSVAVFLAQIRQLSKGILYSALPQCSDHVW
jgi:hypothetical protein